MKPLFSYAIPVVAVAALAWGGTAVAQTGQLSTEERLARLERLLESQSLVDMLGQVEQLQSEIRELRGEVELLNHHFEEVKRRQKDLYLDMDRRMRQLELGGRPAAAAAGAPPSAAAASTPPVQSTAPAPRPAASAPPPPPTAPATADAPPPVDTGEESAYQAAFALLREGRYGEAEGAFQKFLKAHPDGAYAGNAQYWLAESHYVTRNFEQALEAFRVVVAKHPDSPKVPDAKLKIGFIHYELGQWDPARKSLDEVRTAYPGTTVANLAGNRLQRMRAEGH